MTNNYRRQASTDYPYRGSIDVIQYFKTAYRGVEGMFTFTNKT